MATHKSTAKKKATRASRPVARKPAKKMGLFKKILTAEGWRRLLSRKKSAKKR